MSTEMSSPSDRNIFWPLTLLALSWALVLVWQLSTNTQQRAAAIDARAKLDSAYEENVPKQQQLLEQSRAVQAKLETLATELLKLDREGDPEARAIVEKFKIQQNAPAASSSPAANP